MSDKPENLKGDAKILAEAKKRFKACAQWESRARDRFDEDLKFTEGDADNGYQWPNEIRTTRDLDEQPCLTINKTRQHCLQIINDAKQNKPGVTIRAVGGGASFKAAQVFEGIVRHIEYISNAQAAYDTATEFQVKGGIGYWRIVTDYAGDDTFDQEVFIRRVKDPKSIYLDPDICEVDGSDARFGFVFDDRPKDEVLADYPHLKDKLSQSTLDNSEGWIGDEHVRVAEYFRRCEEAESHILLPHTQELVRESTLKKQAPDLHAALDADPTTKRRQVTKCKVEWFKLVGDTIVDRRDWPGRYVPIVRVVGEETIIDGELDRKGHTRALKDAQRMYNYWTSSAAEHVALQGKSPYVAPVQAIEGLETYWKDANRVNHAVLPYNGVDDAGNPIQRPERQAPPQMAAAFTQGMQIAQQEMMMASGQYQAQMGENENAKSGRAIAERQRQGDNATYHFIDHLAVAIRYTGKILIDLIPKVYDTERIIRIMAEDGTESDVTVDPNAQEAYAEQRREQEETVRVIFNPNVGKYAVEADIGPAYSTKRQEAFNAFSQIAAQNSELMAVVGDLLFKNADFPGADVIAERLERLVPAQAKGEGPPPEVQQLQAQLQNMQHVLTEMMQQLADKELKLKAKDAQKDIDVYDAETRRMTAVSNAVPEVGIEGLQALIRQTMADMMGFNLGPVTSAMAPELAGEAGGSMVPALAG